MINKKSIDEWIEHVRSQWLNKWEGAIFRPSTDNLIKDLRRMTDDHKQFDDAWEIIDEIEKLQGILHDDTRTYLKESPQMLLECGIAAYKMGNSRAALHFLKGAMNIYTDTHDSAVARWLLGCVYWHLEDPINALSAWEKSLSDFKEQRTKAFHNIDRSQWYQETISEMDVFIRQATNDKVSSPNHAKPRNNKNIKRHLIRSLPVIGEIPAGTPLNVLPGAVDYLEADNVILNNKIHSISSLLSGERVVNLPTGQRFYVLRVKGNSMNQATPDTIEDGDYVIMREQRMAENGDIVAAEIISGDNKDDRATLKRFVKTGSKIYLIPESNDPAFSKRIDPLDLFTKFDEGFYIWGVALAVLKPLPKADS